MGLWPSVRYRYETEKSKDAIMRIIRESTEEDADSPEFWFRRHGKPFEGEIYEDSFLIKPAAASRRHSEPIIEGYIQGLNDGCAVHIRIRLSIMSVCLIIFFIGGLVASMIAASRHGYSDVEHTVLICVIPGLLYLIFRNQAACIRDRFAEILSETAVKE